MNTTQPSVYMYFVYDVLISQLWGLDNVNLEKPNSVHELEPSTRMHCSLSPASPYSTGFWQHMSVRLGTSFLYALARCTWCAQGSPTSSQMIRWPLLRLINIPLLFQYTLHFLCLSTKGQGSFGYCEWSYNDPPKLASRVLCFNSNSLVFSAFWGRHKVVSWFLFKSSVAGMKKKQCSWGCVLILYFSLSVNLSAGSKNHFNTVFGFCF